MSAPKKTEPAVRPLRIRIHGLSDAREYMETGHLATLGEFFVLYEATNQDLPRSTVVGRMETVLEAMRESVSQGLAQANTTRSGMIDGGAARMDRFLTEGGSLLGAAFSTVVRNTLAVAENNACMGRIVAAPTAGASGVLPGAYLTVADNFQIRQSRIVQGLFVAGGIGECIALQASLSGSQHGCQAENGSASAMTAAALASLFTDDTDAMESAAAFALKSVLGLVCDPVAGLVEVPCIKRNVMAAVNAVASAEMALAGIRTVIPFDEVVQAMGRIGRDMPASLKETSLGGLAATPAGLHIAEVFRKNAGLDQDA